jgi:hypothetical protein
VGSDQFCAKRIAVAGGGVDVLGIPIESDDNKSKSRGS